MTEADRAAVLAQMSTGEKIETVVNSYLRNRTASGKCGTLVEFEPGVYRVEADGLCVIVTRYESRFGWSVWSKGFQGLDSELCVAASHALDGSKGRDVSRNYPVRLPQ